MLKSKNYPILYIKKKKKKKKKNIFKENVCEIYIGLFQRPICKEECMDYRKLTHTTEHEELFFI